MCIFYVHIEICAYRFIYTGLFSHIYVDLIRLIHLTVALLQNTNKRDATILYFVTLHTTETASHVKRDPHKRKETNKRDAAILHVVTLHTTETASHVKRDPHKRKETNKRDTTILHVVTLHTTETASHVKRDI